MTDDERGKLKLWYGDEWMTALSEEQIDEYLGLSMQQAQAMRQAIKVLVAEVRAHRVIIQEPERIIEKLRESCTSDIQDVVRRAKAELSTSLQDE